MSTIASSTAMNQTFLGYYRCPEAYADFRSSLGEGEGNGSGWFRLGADLLCYGHSAAGPGAASAGEALVDVLPLVRFEDSACHLPFHLDEVVTNLRYERYVPKAPEKVNWKRKLVRGGYYAVRPLMGVKVRRHLQRAWLKGWDRKPFPRWPVDRTVDRTFEQAMKFALQAHGATQIPFIWFWPEGKSSCAVMTHDVEEQAGLNFCGKLMDMNDAHAIKTSFQIVPEERYAASEAQLDDIRKRGFEVNVHDLNHDGHLYDNEDQFRERARKINEYGRKFASVGFRSGALYHNLDWYDALSLSYDMSVPNVAHLDPQVGGCCTIMPFFVGEILEMPVTTIQDYSLFHIVNSYSIDVWKRQVGIIMQHHGMANFIVHPDYLDTRKACDAYDALLAHLERLRSQAGLWTPLPREVNAWWRQRDQMRLVRQGNSWKIEGPGSERARVAYAGLESGELRYAIV